MIRIFRRSHVGVPLKGVAVHINAYNFPAWGLWEKASVSLLAGVPVLAKPATATVWLAQEMVQCVIESGVLPEGSLSLACGPATGLLDHLQFGDAVCFTGSAVTGQIVRSHPAIVARGIRVNIEADSLNAAMLGPDAKAGSATFDFFVREVLKEMTIKAGQKCTAIRRILVAAEQLDAVSDALCAQLGQVTVGDPSNAERHDGSAGGHETTTRRRRRNAQAVRQCGNGLRFKPAETHRCRHSNGRLRRSCIVAGQARESCRRR